MAEHAAAIERFDQQGRVVRLPPGAGPCETSQLRFNLDLEEPDSAVASSVALVGSA